MILNILLIILGFILLIKGADILVHGASNIAYKFHIPTIIVGMTIVSIGTSMPELIISATSSLKGHSDLVIGNVIGSNLANLFLILGMCSIIRPLIFKKESKYVDIPFMLSVTLLFYIMCNTGLIVSRMEGIILLVLTAFFIIYNIKLSKNNKKEKEITNISIFKSIIFIILGIIGLKYGGDFVVDNSIVIANKLGLSEQLIGLTIVSLSTSLPELVTGIIACKKGQTELAIGNILGSQVFNVLLIIGVSSVINPINYLSSFNIEFSILILGSILMALFPFIDEKGKMTRKNGVVFVSIYVFYIIYLICINI